MSPTLRSFALAFTALTIAIAATPDAMAAKRKHHVVKSRTKVSMSAGTHDARYADIIMNPTTGEIYHQTDPDGIRYPASLTKMMTLYLLFEALEQHKTTLGARFEVSDYASGMPQTNLHLQEGDSIPVEVAIKALVVRSANDVAVVVGEGLGGDVDHFAQMMTAKARALGMRNTIFKNPNGLPNGGQHTTARDMAKLGIALKRDFPKYYPYFAVRQFSWNGATYYTHNRVMLRYAGTDGIKTGFIGLSGFNLVTSVTRGGRPLVGSVMGGVTGAWRDNRMIQLLDQSYGVIAERGAQKGRYYPENLPLPKNGGKMGVGLSPQQVAAAESATADAQTLDDDAVAKQSADAPEEDGDVQPIVPSAEEVAARTPKEKNQTAEVQKPVIVPKAPVVTPVPAAPAKGPVVVKPALVPPPAKPVAGVPTPAPAAATPFKPAATPTAAPVAAAPLVAPAQSPTNAPTAAPVPAPAVTSKPTDSVIHVSLGGAWGIQVGAFSSDALAQGALAQAKQLAQQPLADARSAIAAPEAGGATVYRARLSNLSEKQAKSACEVLISNNTPCFIYKAN